MTGGEVLDAVPRAAIPTKEGIGRPLKSADLINAARTAIGTPFLHQGRQAGRGLDCAGLLVHVAASVGIQHADMSSYGRRPKKGLLEQTLDGQLGVRPVFRAPQAGDLLLLRFARHPQHLALCAGETIIHSWEAPGKVCEHRFTADWRARVVRVYEFVGVSK